MVETVKTPEFGAWFDSLSGAHQDKVNFYVSLLVEKGLALGHPYSSDIKGSKIGGLRELKVKSHSHALRVFYAFDPARRAVVLIGGDKTGQDEGRFYDRMKRVCETLWQRYVPNKK